MEEEQNEKGTLNDEGTKAWKLLSLCVHEQQKIKSSVEILERTIESEKRPCEKKTRNLIRNVKNGLLMDMT